MLNYIKKLLKSKPKKLFLDVMQEHLIKEETDNNLSSLTKEKHRYQFNNIRDFLREIDFVDCDISQIKYKHVEQLRTWLHANKKCKLNHSTRHVKLCKAACDYAVSMEYIEYNKLSGIKSKRESSSETVSLDRHEVNKLENYMPKRKLWKIVLDLFLFQCYTGLSYSDLWLYEIESESGISLITCKNGRNKTKKRYWAEFTECAKRIHNEYDGKLPEIQNQVYNKILKKICKELQITKRVTTHTGRKTFATLKRNKGYTIPSIALMLGDNDSTTVKHYITRNKELLINEILEMRQKEFNNLRIA